MRGCDFVCWDIMVCYGLNFMLCEFYAMHVRSVCLCEAFILYDRN